MTFHEFVSGRWNEALRRVGLAPGSCKVTWEVKDGYPHFKKKRGYAVCFFDGQRGCHMQYSPKILRAPLHRADAIVRHEIGHVIDFLVPPDDLNEWALWHGVNLPSTPERRADAIAYIVWGEPLRYDHELVQSTKIGTTVRPEHLGL